MADESSNLKLVRSLYPSGYVDWAQVFADRRSEDGFFEQVQSCRRAAWGRAVPSETEPND